MTAAALTLGEPRLTYAEWQAMLHSPVRDKRHLSTQLGSDIADYLSWKENEDGAKSRTIDSYERDLARLALTPGLPAPHTIGPDDLRAVRDSFPKGSRYRVTAVFKDFFRWLYEEGRIDRDPMARVRYPKREKPPITNLFGDEEKAAIFAAQENIRDRTCVLLLLRVGLRKGELRALQVRDIDLADRVLLVRRGKGGKPRMVPIRGSVVRALDEYLMTPIPGLERTPTGDDHILYPTRGANQHATGTSPTPERPMADSTFHRWWYGCLQRAGIVAEGVTRGRRPHSTRHTFATDLGRATDWNMVAVQKGLGHASVALTIDTYTQFALDDLGKAVELLPEIEGA